MAAQEEIPVKMGNNQSNLQMFDPAHVSIYAKLLQIQSIRTRAEMIQTLLAAPEYVQAAKRAAIYPHLLAYIARVNSGERPAALPGETAQAHQQAQLQQAQNYQMVSHRSQAGAVTTGGSQQSNPAAYLAKGRKNEKAMNYFQNCLLVLELEEEVALTEATLRAAYKKAAVKAHPDKGGSEEQFEAVTRAHAYLGEILRRIQGGRQKEGVVEAPTVLKDTRHKDSKDWEMTQPIKLNPNKLDLDAFNKMFEQTRIPDPDDEGYGDWLKSEKAGAAGPKFGGKFNRDVFNQMFEEEARKNPGASGALSVIQAQALTLAPTHGVELGRTAAGSYTAPANAQMKYTDLRQAYESENTFSNQVAGVQVEARSFDAYSAQRKRAPDPLKNSELEAIAEAERQQNLREKQRQIRAAQEMSQADDYFKKMKQLVLTDGAPPVEQSSRAPKYLDTRERLAQLTDSRAPQRR